MYEFVEEVKAPKGCGRYRIYWDMAANEFLIWSCIAGDYIGLFGKRRWLRSTEAIKALKRWFATWD